MRLPYGGLCSAIFESSGPMSLLCPFDFPCQLKIWLLVQGVAPKLHCSGQRVLFCSTISQPKDCQSLLNLLLLDATDFTTAFPLTRQSMHLSVALEKSTVRRVGFGSVLILLSGFTEAIGIRRLLDASRHLETTFFFFYLVSSSPSSWRSYASLESERSRESWNGWYWTKEEDCSIRHVWNYLWSKCLRFGVWCRYTWLKFSDPSWCCQNNQSRAHL